ncbi:MAG: radical SAM protein, partial [Candidatus Omnitrophota bacterium]
TAADGVEQIVTMISSRGCPFQCIFCDVQEKKYRYRSAKNVVDEMEHIAKNFDNPIIHIFDDTFNLIKERVLEICHEINKRGLNVKWTTRARVYPFDEEMVIAMKKAGLKRIHFGIESGSDITLERIKKGVTKKQIVNAFNLCRKHNIDTLAYFIIGFDWETKRDISETTHFIKQISPTYIMANTLYPAAKTVIYEELLNKRKIANDFWREMAKKPVRDFSLPNYRGSKTQKYLNRKIDEIYLTFYLSPNFIFKHLYGSNGGGRKINFFEFFLKIKLSFLIMKSYLGNFFLELSDLASKNEIT